MELSVQDHALLDASPEATTVIGDIDTWAMGYIDSGVVENDYAQWCAWHDRLKEPPVLDASEE